MRILAVLPVGKLHDRVFNEALLPAAEVIAAKVVRVEPEFSSDSKLGAICQEIERADLVIIDVTARNPHTLYLAGYSHGTGRKVLLLTAHGEDFPFDQSKHPVIVYGGDVQFLRSELGAFLSGGSTSTRVKPSAEDARERFETIFGDITRKHGYEHTGEIYMENPTTFVLVNQEMELALVQELARRAREQSLRLKLM